MDYPSILHKLVMKGNYTMTPQAAEGRRKSGETRKKRGVKQLHGFGWIDASRSDTENDNIVRDELNKAGVHWAYHARVAEFVNHFAGAPNYNPSETNPILKQTYRFTKIDKGFPTEGVVRIETENGKKYELRLLKDAKSRTGYGNWRGEEIK